MKIIYWESTTKEKKTDLDGHCFGPKGLLKQVILWNEQDESIQIDLVAPKCNILMTLFYFRGLPFENSPQTKMSFTMTHFLSELIFVKISITCLLVKLISCCYVTYCFVPNEKVFQANIF